MANDPLFEVDLNLATAGSREASRTLYQQLKAAIVDGRLKAGTQLPATRQSSAFFGVSRNTAVEVYERLTNEGFLVSRKGSGTFVADDVPRGRSRRAARPGLAPDTRLNPFWLRPEVTDAMGFWQDRPIDVPAGPRRAPTSRTVDFRPALIDSRLFPYDVFRRISAQQLRALERKPARFKSPQGNQGNHALREAITRHIALTRAVACEADDIIVTSGAQQAFDLLARVLVTPNQTLVALEDPGYPPMRVAFAAAGARLVPIGVDSEGLIVEDLPAEVNVICVCPSHQFPLGVTMSARRRRALVEFARARGAVIVEDDYDGEFRFDASPLQALRTADPADVVFYVGTFSKCMLPALRLGFIVCPDWARDTLVAAKNCLDWHCSTPTQLGVAGFIVGGHLARHVRRLRQVYKKRRALLVETIESEFGAWLELIPSSYGMHVAATARAGVDLEAAARALLDENVHVHTLSRYYLAKASHTGLVFGYGAAGLSELSHGLARLRSKLEGQSAPRRRLAALRGGAS
jgi:GntR family transcriptional regulator/MocR family aminotransferase